MIATTDALNAGAIEKQNMYYSTHNIHISMYNEMFVR